MLLNKELTEKLLAVTTVEEVKQVIEGQDLQTVSRIALNTALKVVFNRTCYGVKDTAIEMLTKLANGEQAEDKPVVPDVKSIKADRRAKVKDTSKAELMMSEEERVEAIDKSLTEFIDGQDKTILLHRVLKTKATGMKEIGLSEEDLVKFSERHPDKYACAINSSGKYYIYKGINVEDFKFIHDKWGDTFFGYPELGGK